MIEVLIIGFGFSAVPLIRELVSTGTEFQVISEEGKSVWDGLSESGRLDFDLVSSYLTSFYSFDLVKDFEKDFYPTAQQFYEMHKRWRKVYADKVVKDRVLRVDNFKDHSVVYTQSGQTLKARHVVFATGFTRAIFKEITQTDYTVSNQTFVFDTMGDSANLIISKLIPNNNKIIIRTNGFNPRDKVVPIAGTTYTLDQLEFHNFRYVSNQNYSSLYVASISTENPALLGSQFPTITRNDSHIAIRSLPSSGTVAIKYWPIDEYCRNFDNNLEEAISQGYLLNDIAMWLHTGKVVVVPKDTPIDFDKKTMTYAGIERSFDQYIKGDAEEPRLPPIMINGVTPYEYLYRDIFMGVIPKALNNVYTIGYTRPYTGGLENMIEMQGLFVHKMVTQPEFYHKIHHNLEDRLRAYNEHYYGNSQPSTHDHLVYYGFYTDDLARLIGIDIKPNECTSLKDLIFYYAFPNNAFKYRLKGEYAVEGVAELIEKINKNFGGFILIFAYVLRSIMMETKDHLFWIKSMKRNFFNDMRYKDDYRPFLDKYIKAYRQLKNSVVEDLEDREWETIVAKACEERDREVQNIKPLSHHQLDEDLRQEIGLVLSLLKLEDSSIENYQSKLDSERFNILLSMINPKEYNLPYLQP